MVTDCRLAPATPVVEQGRPRRPQAILDLFRSLQIILIDTEPEARRLLPDNTDREIFNREMFKGVRLVGYSEAIYTQR